MKTQGEANPHIVQLSCGRLTTKKADRPADELDGRQDLDSFTGHI